MEVGLYIVATPIGNLEDFSIRAQKILNNVDIIICENPKHSLKLLSKFGIKKKLYSLHDYNEEKIIKKIEKNILKSPIALISDAGSPLISDPGFKLVKRYIDLKISITSIPGPSSIISALQVSGIANDSFKFLGFAPKTSIKLNKFIEGFKNEFQTIIFFVSNHRILNCIEAIEKKITGRKICICKELTKINEAVFRGYPKQIIEELKKNKKKILGEFVVLVEGLSKEERNSNKINPSITNEINKLLQKYSLTDVVEIVHRLTNISKKIVYKAAIKEKNE